PPPPPPTPSLSLFPSEILSYPIFFFFLLHSPRRKTLNYIPTSASHTPPHFSLDFGGGGTKTEGRRRNRRQRDDPATCKEGFTPIRRRRRGEKARQTRRRGGGDAVDAAAAVITRRRGGDGDTVDAAAAVTTRRRGGEKVKRTAPLFFKKNVHTLFYLFGLLFIKCFFRTRAAAGLTPAWRRCGGEKVKEKPRTLQFLETKYKSRNR
ncbi:hypothetical protein LINPERPRIM_LOCUS5121, partial [Linum perenne]